MHIPKKILRQKCAACKVLQEYSTTFSTATLIKQCKKLSNGEFTTNGGCIYYYTTIFQKVMDKSSNSTNIGHHNNDPVSTDFFCEYLHRENFK